MLLFFVSRYVEKLVHGKLISQRGLFIYFLEKKLKRVTHNMTVILFFIS